MLQMARHKFASNVCEKALKIADPENRRLLIDEIMTPKQDNVNPIGAMMRDQFASQCFILRPVRDLKRLLFFRLRSTAGLGLRRRGTKGGIILESPSSARQHAEIFQRL